MTDIQKTISPVDGRVYVERPLATDALLQETMERSRHAQAQWKRVPLDERIAIVNRFIDAFVARKEKIAEEISWQMGRPISQSPGEVRGFEERARYMASIAPESLADMDAGPKQGFRRFIRREPLGVVLVTGALELPLPHVRELRRAGDPGRQCGDPETLEPDTAVRGAVCRVLQGSRLARWRLPVSCIAHTTRARK